MFGGRHAVVPELDGKPLRVCLFGTYATEHSRIQILVRGLRANGAVVHECVSPLWAGISDRVRAASGGWLDPRFWLRVIRVYATLILKYLRAPRHDVLIVGYPGQIDCYLAKALTCMSRRPVVLDLLMSIFWVAEERGLTARHPFTGRLIHAIERGALRFADLVFCENEDYVRELEACYGRSAGRFRCVGHGVNDAAFVPRERTDEKSDIFRIVYHGGFLRSHGIPTAIRAAALLRGEKDVRFAFYGTGPERETCLALARELDASNAHFPGFVPHDELVRGIADADLLLGVFGSTRHARITVQNKIWEAMGMGKPVVSGDSPTVRRTLTHGTDVFLVERENPAALAEAVLRLKADRGLRVRLGQAARLLVERRGSMLPLGTEFLRGLREAMARRFV
jgi:glycosyltransferase involved in cell wall biosynthesis